MLIPLAVVARTENIMLIEIGQRIFFEKFVCISGKIPLECVYEISFEFYAKKNPNFSIKQIIQHKKSTKMKLK